MTKPLPYDYSRCFGQNCKIKENCQRYLTLAIDEPRLLSCFVTLQQNGVCNGFIEDK